MVPMLLAVVLTAGAEAPSYRFDMTGARKVKAGYTALTPDMAYDAGRGYGYDFKMAPGNGNEPFFLSVDVPDGNYKVTVTLGSAKAPGETTVRSESRRMHVNNLATKKGELVTETFVVNKHNDKIDGKKKVKLHERERQGLNWDDKLTLEFNGDAPRVSYVEIEPVDVPTLFMCGDSTTVDNVSEPFTGWAQMLPLFLDENVAVANYAESGLSAGTFLADKRLDKIETQMKEGDYLFIQFGHNDQKDKNPGYGAYYSFTTNLKKMVDRARKKGVIPVLVTPTVRRRFEKGAVRNTHGDYPDAVRVLAQREGIHLIDFWTLTKTMVEAAGPEASKSMFVHYPMDSFKGQEKALSDDTHFSVFGAWEISKIFANELQKTNHPLSQYVKKSFKGFDPAAPDQRADFKYVMSPFVMTKKPAGN